MRAFADAISSSDLDGGDYRPEGVDTHYIPAFTQRRGRLERAVCQRMVDPVRQFSTDPTCEECAALLEDDTHTTASLAREFPDLARVLDIDDPRR